MSISAEEKYEDTLKTMMAIAGVASRLGLGSTHSLPVYQAWQELYPTDAYAWLSKALIEIGNGNTSKAKQHVQEAIEQSKTNKVVAEEAMQWFSEDTNTGS